MREADASLADGAMSAPPPPTPTPPVASTAPAEGAPPKRKPSCLARTIGSALDGGIFGATIGSLMATGPAFSSAVGLCLYSAHPQDEWWDFDIPADTYPARSLKRAMKWFRDNW